MGHSNIFIFTMPTSVFISCCSTFHILFPRPGTTDIWIDSHQPSPSRLLRQLAINEQQFITFLILLVFFLFCGINSPTILQHKGCCSGSTLRDISAPWKATYSHISAPRTATYTDISGPWTATCSDILAPWTATYSDISEPWPFTTPSCLSTLSSDLTLGPMH